MLYQIIAPPTAALDKQADELGRLLKHSKTLAIQFVTVAGSYKASRARLVMLAAPERFAEHTARVMSVICSREDATKQSQAVKMRPEWKHVALLVPTDPNAPAIDGTVLDGWDSAFLTVTYRPGRVVARLLHCMEDKERVANLKLDGWQLLVEPNPLQLVANVAGRPWNGVPSFTSVPGGVTTAAVPRAASIAHEVPPMIDAPAPIHQEFNQALTESTDGFLLGVTPQGEAVRLARRSMTLSVSGPQEARQRAVLALLRRGMQAGMGIIAVVDRSLLPSEALQTWEARVRLLDVQNIADSSAIPWREIAPDLLAQAIGGPSASLPALPSRFAAVLDTLEAESLRVPAVLGLATMPGDDLRGALAAGGLVVVPQDGDAASTIVARLLMAYLATPPAIGRGLLVLADAAIVLPEALRQQAIQVVVGERGDALLRLASTDAGWKLCGPDGSPVAQLLSDLMTQPTEGAGDMVDSIVRDIGIESAHAPALTSVALTQAPIDEDDGWWADGERTDDLSKADDEVASHVADEEQGSVTSMSNESEPLAALVAELFADEVLSTLPDEIDEKQNAVIEMLTIENMSAHEQSDDLDMALGKLLNALRADVPMNAIEEQIQAAIVGEDFLVADAAALAWSVEAPQSAKPWIWRVVLTEEDTDRAIAVWRAIQIEPEGAHVTLIRAVLDVMGAGKPADWLARIGDEMLDDGIDDGIQSDDLNTAVGLDSENDDTPLQSDPELRRLADELPSLTILAEEREITYTPLAPEIWEMSGGMRTVEPAVSIEVHAEIAPLITTEEQHERVSPALPVVAPISVISMPIVGSAELSDDAIRLIWQSGESVPQLVARLVASGVDALTARTRVRAIVNVRRMDAATMSFTTVNVPPIPSELSSLSLLPVNLTALMPEPSLLVDQVFVASANSANGTRASTILDGEITDEAIWHHWQTGTKTDDISIAICGKRGGPKADAARDRMYSVVIPRIIAALNCDDLVDRIAAGEPAGSDPRYPELTKRLARSETAPVGSLERSLIKRLMNTRQEV